MGKHIITIVALSTLCTVHVAKSQTVAVAKPAFQETSLDSAKGSVLSQLSDAAREANQEGLTPILDVGASWCEPCHVLDHLIHDGSMKAVMKKMYVIHADLDVWQKPLAETGADVTTGIPRLFAIDHTGRLSREPWRPRDIPDSLSAKGMEEAFRLSLIDYFKHAKAHFAQRAASADKQSTQ